MNRGQAVGWALGFTLGGGGLLVYLLRSLSPWQADGQLNRPVVLLFFCALLIAVTGLTGAVALALHRRYPTLGGGNRYKEPRPAVALRQGFLAGCAAVILALLAFFQIFDVIFLIAVPLLAGLLEAYLQHRPVR
jgi:hypothetical protein